MPPEADVGELSLEDGRIVSTQAAGLFLFVPLLLEAGFSQAVAGAGYPGSKQIPAVQAMLVLLASKLLGKRRVSHITDLASDEGAGLFAGLNALPKTTYATDYSYCTERIIPSLKKLASNSSPRRFPGCMVGLSVWNFREN